MRRMLAVMENGLIGLHHLRVFTKLMACVRVPVELREVAAGYLHPDTMPFQEAVAG